jgi:outer membrane immunogenic protein
LAQGELEASMKLLYAVGLAALVFETTATFAADIPVAETVFKAQPPVSDWSGFYVGAGLGFRSTTTNANVNSAIDTTRGPVLMDRFLASNCYIGFPCVAGRPYNAENERFSPYFGYNWQANSHWVLGVEADVAFGSQTITTNNYYPATPFRGTGAIRDSFSAKADWDASIRARVGYLITPDLMVYGTAGPAWLRLQSTSNCSTLVGDDGDCSSGNGFVGLSPGSLTHSTTRLGATVGGGLEAMLSPNWIVRGEYRYSDYGTVGYTDVRSSPTGTQTVKYDLSARTHAATFGLAYKFGEPARAAASPLSAYGAIAYGDKPISTSWTGAYIGAAVGVRANRTNAAIDSAVITRQGNPPVNAITGCECFLDNAMNTTEARFSPYAGYNWQFSPKWLAGIEGDFGWANQKATISGVNEPGSVLSASGGINDSYSVAAKWDASLRLRIGYVVSPSLMIFATAGPAVMSLEETSRCDTTAHWYATAPGFSAPKIGNCAPGQRTPVDISNSSTRPGFTIGGGGEAKLWDHWVARAEYRYSDFGTAKFNDSRSCNGTTTLHDPVLGTVTQGCFENDAVRTAVRVRTNTAMFGLAYTFD